MKRRHADRSGSARPSRWRFGILLAAGWCLGAAAPPAVAGPASAPRGAPVTPELRAADAALQGLIDAVMKLPLQAGGTVAAVLGRTAAGQCALRQAILTEHQQSRSRRLADGTVEMDAWLPNSRLTEILQQVAAEHLPEVNRAALVVAAAAGPVAVATGRCLRDGRLRDDRPGWRHCDARQITLAVAAAKVDLRQQLLARIAGLRFSAHHTVADLLDRHPRFREAAHRRVNAILLGEAVFEPTGLCRLTVELGRAETLRLLTRAAGEAGEEIEVDFSRATDPELQDPLCITGFGLAPPGEPAPGVGSWSIDVDRPAWADQFLTASAAGKAPPEAGDEKARRTLAARAARIEATRRLWIKIEQLPLPGGGTIAARLARDPQTLARLAALDDAILPVTTPVFSPDGTASVTVGIRLETVWRSVHDARARVSN